MLDPFYILKIRKIPLFRGLSEEEKEIIKNMIEKAEKYLDESKDLFEKNREKSIKKLTDANEEILKIYGYLSGIIKEKDIKKEYKNYYEFIKSTKILKKLIEYNRKNTEIFKKYINDENIDEYMKFLENLIDKSEKIDEIYNISKEEIEEYLRKIDEFNKKIFSEEFFSKMIDSLSPLLSMFGNIDKESIMKILEKSIEKFREIFDISNSLILFSVLLIPYYEEKEPKEIINYYKIIYEKEGKILENISEILNSY